MDSLALHGVSEREEARAERRPPSTVIQPSSGWAFPNLTEIWHYRDLLYFLIWRDIKVRYKQTAVGGAWAVLQPLLMMVVFTIIFGRVARLSSSGVPYPLFTYCALLPWQLFMQGLNAGGTSLVVNERLITKVYFPRILVPSAAVLAGLLDLGVASLLLIALMLFYGIMPTLALFTAPLFLLLLLVVTLGLCFWLSALDVQYRDVRHTIPLLTQLWLLATPVFYSSDLLPEAWRIWYGLNPMAGVVEGFRWSLLGQGEMLRPMVGVSAAVALAVFGSGLLYFRRMEKTMADVV